MCLLSPPRKVDSKKPNILSHIVSCWNILQVSTRIFLATNSSQHDWQLEALSSSSSTTTTTRGRKISTHGVGRENYLRAPISYRTPSHVQPF